MKNIVTISLIIFIVVVVVALGATVLQKQPAQNNTPTTISLLDVAKHNTASDCWTVVGDKAYNITNLLPNHPGGIEKMKVFCGTDSTVAFNTRAGNGPHPQKAQESLNNYYLGNLEK